MHCIDFSIIGRNTKSDISRNSLYLIHESTEHENTRVYPKFSELTAWSENCKWYSPLPIGAVVSLFCESV